MSEIERIDRIHVATIRAALPGPITFGAWRMTHREFALVEVISVGGATGYGFGYTRDGPVAEIVRRNIAPHYVGQVCGKLDDLFHAVLWSNPAVLASGIGHRALGIVDLAVWDVAAKLRGQSITRFLGGSPHALPVTAIVGYPPDIAPEEIADQVRVLHKLGWRRFKLPIAPNLELTLARVRSASEAAADISLGLDCNWVFKDLGSALELVKRLEGIRLSWLEDVFPPGEAWMLAALSAHTNTPIATGDEQGGSYFPEALLRAKAVDVVRIDATTQGGVSRLRPVIDRIREAGARFAPHMFPHVHSQLVSAWGFPDVPIEWGVPGSGVDPYTDSLPQPVVIDGHMEPLDEKSGFGPLVNVDWARDQMIDDPDGILTRVPTAT